MTIIHLCHHTGPLFLECGKRQVAGSQRIACSSFVSLGWATLYLPAGRGPRAGPVSRFLSFPLLPARLWSRRPEQASLPFLGVKIPSPWRAITDESICQLIGPAGNSSVTVLAKLASLRMHRGAERWEPLMSG